MQKALAIDAGKCTGCKQCELACSFEHEGIFNISRSRIRVFIFEEEARFVPYTCTQCDQAWCMQVCPVGAITSDPDSGVKSVNAATCVGCKVCTIACPFGTINYNAGSGKVEKCDLCGGDPACVRECPTDAITFIDSGLAGFAKMQDWAARTDTAPQATS